MSEIPKNLKMEYCSGSFYVIKGADGLLYPEQLAEVIRRAEAYSGLVEALENIKEDAPQDEFDAMAVFATKLQKMAEQALKEQP